MFLQVIVLAIAATLASTSPIDSHASSYVSSSFGGIGNQGGNDYGYGSHVVAAPVYTHHEIPTVVHKVVTPIIKKVPIYVQHQEQQEEYGPAEYHFEYAVADKHTGDIKSQKENRHGDVVEGEYSLKEADGTVRVVKYTADKKNGFNAVVLRQGHAAHPQVVQKEVQLHKVVVPVKKYAVPIVEQHGGYQQLLSHY